MGLLGFTGSRGSGVYPDGEAWQHSAEVTAGGKVEGSPLELKA